MPVIVAIALVSLAILLRLLVRRAVLQLIRMARELPARMADSRAWARSHPIRARLAQRHPSLATFIARRFDPHQPAGLLLTLTALAALYLAALFSGLTENILEAQGTIEMDDTINAALGSWRTEPWISIFLWITGLGNSSSVVAAVIIATGFLWSHHRFPVAAALWVACLGSMATTTIGKLLIARHRPEFVLDVTAAGWSFPSGHATGAMAVYGLIAYAIGRTVPGFAERFEVAYWTGILILLIGFSRIFLGVHYFTDVVGGFLVGGFWLLIGFSIAELSHSAPQSGSRGS